MILTSRKLVYASLGLMQPHDNQRKEKVLNTEGT